MEQNNVSFQNVKTGEPLSQKEIDEMFMRRCLQLAKNGRENAKPNPMVGAVIVSGDGRIIGEGYHVRCGEGHAELKLFPNADHGAAEMKTDEEVDLILDFIDRHIWEGEHLRTPLPKEIALL